MGYCSQQDIEGRFGPDNVRVWSNLDPGAAQTDTARVASAIAYAGAYLDARLARGRWALPLRARSGDLTLVRDLAARLAGLWLVESRGVDYAQAAPPMAEQRHYVESQLQRVLNGELDLHAVTRTAGSTVPRVVE